MKIIHFFRAKIQHVIGIILFVITTATIILIFPIERRFEYEFQKGKPWMHEDLYAPFDFPIYKTDAELSLEKDSLSRIIKNYFSLDTTVYNLVKGNIFQQINNHAFQDKNKEKLQQKDSAKYFSTIHLFIDQLLTRYYKKGIINLAQIKNVDYSEEIDIILIAGKIAEEIKLGELTILSNAKLNMQAEIAVFCEKHKEYNFVKELSIHNNLIENVLYDNERSSQMKANMLANISLTRGMLQESERIISKGDIVNDKAFKILRSLKREYESTNVKSSDIYKIMLGQIMLILPAVLALALIIYFIFIEVLESKKKSLFITILILLFVGLTSIFSRSVQVNIYVIPFIILPIVIKTFINIRVAIYTHIIAVLIAANIVPNSFEFSFMQIITGIITLFTIGNDYKRSYLFLAAVVSFTCYSTIYMGFSLLHELDWSKIQLQSFVWFAASSGFILISYPLIFIFEKTFGFVSDLRLIELSDTNNALLRKMSDLAPGSFQHSLQVANLSEIAIKKIGGNALLTRVGALYHDIGKQLQPTYFTENQVGGINPHNNHSPIESAKIIISHVTEGVKLAKKHNLPKQIINFIKTHQGTTRVKYFYTIYKNENPNLEINESDFTYPFHIPTTKEEAVVMMADAVEATSRSLKEINEKNLKEMIDKIIESQFNEKQFENADITLKDITAVKESFLQRLMNMYHARISYPELKNN